MALSLGEAEPSLGQAEPSRSCECERGRSGGVASSIGCSGERARDRPGPCFGAFVDERGAIGRGPAVVPAGLLAALVVRQARREVVERFLGVFFNIQGTKATKRAGWWEEEGSRGEISSQCRYLEGEIHSIGVFN